MALTDYSNLSATSHDSTQLILLTSLNCNLKNCLKNLIKCTHFSIWHRQNTPEKNKLDLVEQFLLKTTLVYVKMLSHKGINWHVKRVPGI